LKSKKIISISFKLNGKQIEKNVLYLAYDTDFCEMNLD